MSPPEVHRHGEGSSMNRGASTSTSAAESSKARYINQGRSRVQLDHLIKKIKKEHCFETVDEDRHLIQVKKQQLLSKLIKQKRSFSKLLKNIKNAISQIRYDNFTERELLDITRSLDQNIKKICKTGDCNVEVNDKGCQVEEQEIVSRAIYNLNPNWSRVHTTTEQQHRFELQNQLVIDVTFLLGPQLQAVHCVKFPLALLSRAIATMLCGDVENPSDVTTIELTDVSPEIFNKFLEYIYFEQFKSLILRNFTEVYELMKVAKKFDVPELKNRCQYYTWLHINRNTIWTALDFLISTDSNISFLSMLLTIDAERTLQSIEFLNISARGMSEIMSTISSQFNFKSEETLLDACIRWCQVEVDHRANESNPPCLQDIFANFRKYIRFLNLTPQVFATYTSSFDILPTNDVLNILKAIILRDITLSLPDYVIKSFNPRIPENDVRYINVSKVNEEQLNENGNLKDTSEPSIHEIISAITINVNQGSQLCGIIFSTRTSEEAEEYKENFSVYVNDIINKKHIYSIKNVHRKLPRNSEYQFEFTNTIHFNLSASVPTTTIEIKILFHNSGKYPLYIHSANKPDVEVIGNYIHHYQPIGTHNIIKSALFKNIKSLVK